ncbi:ATP-binding protein [Candidatus Poriferisodalis sp.]|uniref:ATP-binding protein n=1 Tax=Candidatus Poriferisodalis sp. TaxID=3101277 RepID=UPI003C6F4CBE
MVTWQPTQQDFHEIFNEQNPWHRSGMVPPAFAPSTERFLAGGLWKRLLSDDPRRHHVVLGPRRVGKTTVLYQTVRRLIGAGVPAGKIWWLRLDHPLLVQASLGDLVRGLLEGSRATAHDPLFLLLDEIVYADSWNLWLKTFYDEHWPVRIAATSSGTAALRKQRHESGIGRWELHHLMPCLLDEAYLLTGIAPSAEPALPDPGPTLGETLGSLLPGPVLDGSVTEMRRFLIMVGGFPELLIRSRPLWNESGPADFEDQVLESQRILRGDAVARAVYQDIPQAAGVDNPMNLERLLYLLASDVTGILSPTRLSRELGIAQPTLERYVSFLEQAYLIFTLSNYSSSEHSIQRRGRKVYFTDCAVRNAALQRGLAPLQNPEEQGVLLENLVAASVRVLAWHSDVRLHHWRDGSSEVDLIYDDPRQPVAFEIASSPGHHRKGLAALIDRFEQFRGHSYLVAPQAPVLPAGSSTSGIGTLPLDTFLRIVGQQARLAMAESLGVAG